MSNVGLYGAGKHKEKIEFNILAINVTLCITVHFQWTVMHTFGFSKPKTQVSEP